MDNMRQRQRLEQSAPPTPQQAGASSIPTPPEQAKQELNEAIQDSNDVVASATTTLTIFPDTICVDRTKINVSKRSFFSTAEVTSLRLEDILSVTASLGPFFGTLKIVSRVMNNELPYKAGRFWRKDAMKLKHVIQGFVIAYKRNIDCSMLQTTELAVMIEKLGQDEH